MFFLVVAGLALLAACFTSAVSLDSEHTFFLADNPLLNLVAAGLFALALALLMRTRPLQAFAVRLTENDRLFALCKGALLALVFAAAALWCLTAHAAPHGDAAIVQGVAGSFLEGDRSSFAPGNYIDHYPQQLGLFWISVGIDRLIGPYHYLVVQLGNALGASVAYKQLSEIGGMNGLGRLGQLGVIVCGIAFFPLLQYSLFLYGNLWGLALSLVAVKHELRFLDGLKIRNAAGCALAIAGALTFKSNYIIFFIGMVLYALVRLTDIRKMRVLVLVALLALGFAVQAIAPLAAARAATGEPLDQGESPWSWVAMGLQESWMAPGWYTDYNYASYQAAGYNTAAQAEMAKENIGESIAYFSAHGDYAARFFVQKVASEWNNPTFQGFWIVGMMVNHDPANLGKAEWVNPRTTEYAARYLNIVQFIVLVGALVWCACVRWRSEHAVRAALLPLVFLGGFVCHLFWEAKCQYTLPFFTLLIPFSVQGYALACRQLACALGQLKKPSTAPSVPKLSRTFSASLRSGLRDWTPVIALSALVLAGFITLMAGGMADYLAAGTADYQQFLIDFVEPDRSLPPR